MYLASHGNLFTYAPFYPLLPSVIRGRRARLLSLKLCFDPLLGSPGRHERKTIMVLRNIGHTLSFGRDRRLFDENI